MQKALSACLHAICLAHWKLTSMCAYYAPKSSHRRILRPWVKIWNRSNPKDSKRSRKVWPFSEKRSNIASVHPSGLRHCRLKAWNCWEKCLRFTAWIRLRYGYVWKVISVQNIFYVYWKRSSLGNEWSSRVKVYCSAAIETKQYVLSPVSSFSMRHGT